MPEVIKCTQIHYIEEFDEYIENANERGSIDISELLISEDPSESE